MVKTSKVFESDLLGSNPTLVRRRRSDGVAWGYQILDFNKTAGPKSVLLNVSGDGMFFPPWKMKSSL